MIKVIILAANPQTRSVFVSALEKREVQYEEAESVLTMRQKMLETPFNGVILDVLTTVRAAPQEKVILQEVSELYPTLRLRWDTRKQCFRGLILGQAVDRENPVSDFLEKFCRSAPYRTFREHRRIPLHFNVLLSTDREFSAYQTEKSVTLDISMGGCFLFSTRNWNNGDVAWVRFVDFPEQEPYQAEIRRFMPWGRGGSFPGIGVKFVNLRPGQISELRRRLDHL